MRPEVDFDWDEANIGHVARHGVRPEETQQVMLNEPIDMGMEIVDGEERHLSLGATTRGRVLLVVTTWRQERVRVVTAFEPINDSFSFTTRNERGDSDAQETAALQDRDARGRMVGEKPELDRGPV